MILAVKSRRSFCRCRAKQVFRNPVGFLFRKTGIQTGFLPLGSFNSGVATEEKQEADNTNHWLISLWSRRKGKTK